MKMQLLFLIAIMFFLSAYSMPRESETDSTAEVVLLRASRSGEPSAFSQFLTQLKTLDSVEQEQFLLRKKINLLVLKFHERMLCRRPTRSIFETHLHVAILVQDNAESSEMVAEEFSHYFLEHLKVSLKTLEQFSDSSTIMKLVADAVFQEGAGPRIVNFIEKNKLTRKTYYSYFLPYKE